MRRVVVLALVASCAAAQFVTPNPSVMPAWMVPFPGATAENKQSGNTAESAYSIHAPAHEVLTHFRTLFASAGLPFKPDPMGHGFLIRAAAPECDLAIAIRRTDPDTNVKVTCSPRLASTERIVSEHSQQRAEQTQNDPMKKFDSPVYPQGKPHPPITWPSWLVCVDGTKLAVEKSPGRLKSSFTSMPPRDGIQAYYAGLLSSHGYRVTQGLAAVPEKFGAWVTGTTEPDNAGRRTVIWVKIRPAGHDFTVELSLQ